MREQTFERMDRLSLARLGREYMIAAQFNSRTGYAALRINHGDDAYLDTAVDNWMGASPVYTRRMQRAMGFANRSDVATIFKGLQLECGFAHQYFDVHFEVESAERGRFWLPRCGALLEAEPRGEAAVRTMCHDIEDPTFDATATATNPRARMRPVHRPPRTPSDRQPHCEWRVFIDPDAAPLEAPAITGRVADSVLAQLDVQRPEGLAPGGMDDYSGPLLEQLDLERLSHTALVVVVKELAIQHHLLINTLLLVIAERYGDAAARAVAEFQLTGSGRVVSERLRRSHAAGLAGAEALRAVLALHPALQPPEYIDLQLEAREDGVILELGDCAAARENMPHSWFSLLAGGADTALESLVRGIDPAARVTRSGPGAMRWEITTGAQIEEEEPLAVQVARGAVLYRTQMEDRLALLEIA